MFYGFCFNKVPSKAFGIVRMIVDLIQCKNRNFCAQSRKFEHSLERDFDPSFLQVIVILLSLLPLLWMWRNSLVRRVTKFQRLWIIKIMLLCDESIHDATENYYERGTYSCRLLTNIKFPLFMFKVLKLHLFCLPMLVDSCSHKLFSHKSPMHRKWVACHVIHDALIMFQFLCFMRASLKSSCLAKRH